eukprot:TRINITY_DN9526_c1_g1_i2.p1 TRINITY_DN9526_c1_g1~~TRINITY_DN9526_c1_g1_i2.p1  ORF type:complete len:419 (+),score=107.34 TRINITY_DN9526_c1_g1_i2:59-1258(+)
MCDPDEDDDCCPCCSRQTQDRTYVFVVILIITFSYLNYWYLIVLPWVWHTTFVGWCNLIFLNTSFVLLCYCYYKAMYTFPGTVPVGWIPEGSPKQLAKAKEQKSLKSEDKDRDVSNLFRPRWCSYCQQYKPLRTFHSKDINRCVLRMDHYCPWVYNAVGWYNHKYFILFLIYATLSLSYFLGCCIIRIYFGIKNSMKGRLEFTTTEIVFLVLQFCLTLPITLAIASLLFHQISCVMNGMTSIEGYIFERYKKYHARKSKKKLLWFYDHGLIENLKEVLGNDIRYWLIPTVPLHVQNGPGTNFKVRPEMSEFVELALKDEDSEEFSQSPPPLSSLLPPPSPPSPQQPSQTSSSPQQPPPPPPPPPQPPASSSPPPPQTTQPPSPPQILVNSLISRSKKKK